MGVFGPSLNGGLALASRLRLHELVKRLLATSGVDINYQQGHGTTALHTAADCHKPEVLELLLGHGIHFVPDSKGETPLHRSVRENDVESIKVLLKYHVNLDVQDSRGLSALWVAARYNGVNAATLLLNGGAAVDLDDSQGQTPLHAALCYEQYEAADVLLEKGANIESKTHDEKTILSRIIRQGLADTARAATWLIKAGAKVDAANAQLQTPLAIAAEDGRLGIVDLLLEAGASLDSTCSKHRTPLSYAAGSGQYAVTKLLMERTANVHAADSEGRTPLSHAANLFADSNYDYFELEDQLRSQTGGLKVMTALLEHEASPDGVNISEWVPWDRTLKPEKDRVMQLLSEAQS